MSDRVRLELSPERAWLIATWLRRVNPRGAAEADAIASTVHELEVKAAKAKAAE